MKVKELINRLERLNPEAVVRVGVGDKGISRPLDFITADQFRNGFGELEDAFVLWGE